MIMRCQGKFISCNKRTTLVGDVNNGGGYAYVEVYGKSWEISVLYANFVVKA